ncbi:MAG: DNA-directed RNA polymerase sigma-70 factor [Nitrospirales bacterium]|nr:MAG: DNA-directed RNA polymerase sigma-70 factor [Nitrospirales bacterium]
MHAAAHEYYGELLAFFTNRLRSKDQAADVVQETFLRVFTASSTQPIKNVRALLYKTATNITVDLFRKQQKQAERSVVLDEAYDCPAREADPERVAVGKEELLQLSHAIAELPPKCRHVFLLHKVRGKSHREIAEHLGISHNMVEKHIMKGLAHCRQRLDAEA